MEKEGREGMTGEKKGGCYQWMYCSECMLIDDCPNPNNKKVPNYWKNATKEKEKENFM